MPNNTKLALPFLTRKMLAFEHGTRFNLRIRSKSMSAQPITIRGMTSEGVFTLSHTPTSDSLEKIEIFNIPDIPIMVSVVDENIRFLQGKLYVTLDLLVNGDKLIELCSGLVYQSKSISWPIDNSSDKLPGGGQVAVITGTNPAAGTEATINVTTGEQWRVKSVRASLTTDATVASRRVHLQIQSVGNTYIDVFSDIDQLASTTRAYYFTPLGDVPDREDNNIILCPLPDNLVLPQGFVIITKTFNIQAADDHFSLRVLYERYFN